MKFTNALLALLTPVPSTPDAAESSVVEADGIRATDSAASARGQQQEQKRAQTPDETLSVDKKVATTTSPNPPSVASETAEEEEVGLLQRDLDVDVGLLQRDLLSAADSCPNGNYVDCVNGFLAHDDNSCSETCDQFGNCSGSGSCARCETACGDDCCVTSCFACCLQLD